jgi:hypothetical protein
LELRITSGLLNNTAATMASTSNLACPAADSKGSRGIVVVKSTSTQQAMLQKLLGR